MSNDTTKQPISQLTPAEARAHLSVVTGMMQKMIPQGSPAQETAPQQGGNPQTDKQPTEGKKGSVEAKVELNMTDKLDELRKEMKDDMQREMDGIKTMIQQALTEEDNEPTETSKPA